jgi:hypothetical protein
MTTYNTANEIKKLLLLETENQTIDDDDIDTYLEDAQEELFNELGRNRETDKFKLRSWHINDDDNVEHVLYFVATEVLEVRDATNNDVISSSNYDLIRGNQGIKIRTGSDDANLDENIEIEIDYIPKNYKMAERAIAIENILTRLQPFQNEQINPSLMVWREKRKKAIEFIIGKFGVGSFN